MDDLPRKANTLKVISWIIVGTISRKHEIDEFSERCQPDIKALQETRLAADDRYSMQGYYTNRNDPTVGRRHGYPSQEDTGIPPTAYIGPLPNAEASGIQISMTNCKIRLLSKYKPPNPRLTEET